MPDLKVVIVMIFPTAFSSGEAKCFTDSKDGTAWFLARQYVGLIYDTVRFVRASGRVKEENIYDVDTGRILGRLIGTTAQTTNGVEPPPRLIPMLNRA